MGWHSMQLIETDTKYVTRNLDDIQTWGILSRMDSGMKSGRRFIDMGLSWGISICYIPTS
jgi:hypothetical protein